MKLYDLCIVVGHSCTDWNGQYAIIIEDFYPNCYIIEVWIFEINNERGDIVSISPNNLRLATEEEQKEFQNKFKQYCNKNGD